MTKEEAKSIVESMMDEICMDIANSDDEVTSAIAVTNATFFTPEDYEVSSSEYNARTGEITFQASADLTGDQDDEKPFNGDSLAIEFTGTIKRAEKEWALVKYEVVSCVSNADREL